MRTFLLAIAVAVLSGCALPGWVPAPDCPLDRNSITSEDMKLDCRVHWTFPLGENDGDPAPAVSSTAQQSTPNAPAAAAPATNSPESGHSNDKGDHSGGRGHDRGHNHGCGD